MSIAKIHLVNELTPEIYTAISKALASALSDDETTAVILYCDSPGGDVCPALYTLADQIFHAVKPIVAFVDGSCTSCAYWLISQADSITATRGSFVGGIGLYVLLEDSSEKLRSEGVTLHRVATSPAKGADASGVSITEETKQILQEELSQIESIFHADIKRARPDVDIEKVSDGKTHIAASAQGLGLVDSVGNWSDFVSANFDQV